MKFIVNLLFFSLLSLGQGCVDEPEPGHAFDVIIIGSGTAGFSAADHLVNQYGLNSILILEARNRTGGRIETMELSFVPGYQPGTVIDLGAQYLRGNIDNPVYDFAIQHGLAILEENSPFTDQHFYKTVSLILTKSFNKFLFIE